MPELTQINRPILPYRILHILDVAMINDILHEIPDLPPYNDPLFWVYQGSIRYLLGYELTAPTGYTLEIGLAIQNAARKWMKENAA